MVKIFVGNVQAESCRETEAELRHLFEQFGEVTECDILTGKTFGFVHMTKEEEADAAINGLDGAYVFGGNLNVQKSSNPGGSRRGGRGGSSRGHDRNYNRGGGSRYQPYSRMDPYDLYDDPFMRYPYPLPRDPYGRDDYLRELYAREFYAREAYLRRLSRDPYYQSREDYGRPYRGERSYDGRSERYSDKEKSSSSAPAENGSGDLND